MQVTNSQFTSPKLLPTWSAHREARDDFQLSALQGMILTSSLSLAPATCEQSIKVGSQGR